MAAWPARCWSSPCRTAREDVIRDKISRQDIAKMVGASREMVSRVMKDLEDRGFIETRADGSMLVKDRLTTLG
jgi:CRP/FNR family cyclic AMP-dependent transcriptional regulator